MVQESKNMHSTMCEDNGRWKGREPPPSPPLLLLVHVKSVEGAIPSQTSIASHLGMGMAVRQGSHPLLLLVYTEGVDGAVTAGEGRAEPLLAVEGRAGVGGPGAPGYLQVLSA